MFLYDHDPYILYMIMLYHFFFHSAALLSHCGTKVVLNHFLLVFVFIFCTFCQHRPYVLFSHSQVVPWSYISITWFKFSAYFFSNFNYCQRRHSALRLINLKLLEKYNTVIKFTCNFQVDPYRVKIILILLINNTAIQYFHPLNIYQLMHQWRWKPSEEARCMGSVLRFVLN